MARLSPLSFRPYRVPFFVAAPVTTVDLDVADGAGIPIEQRGEEELTHFRCQRVVTEGIDVRSCHCISFRCRAIMVSP